MKTLLLVLIAIYQKTLSPDHGLLSYNKPYGHCRFYPSCSQYAYESIERHGAVRGIYYSIIRVVRCNPFNKGGWDPPKK